jgi:hypothetical protein
MSAWCPPFRSRTSWKHATAPPATTGGANNLSATNFQVEPTLSAGSASSSRPSGAGET